MRSSPRRRHAKRKTEHKRPKNLSLLLGAEHGLADVGASETHVGGLLELEHGVHGREVGAGALEFCDVLDVDVGFLCEFLLSHRRALLVLELVARLHEGLCDFFGDLLGGDGAVGAVDFGEALATEVGAGGL